jgi:electron transport complex protein RnfD
MMSPVDVLLEVYASAPVDGASRVRDLALHELPRWESTLIGGVSGGAGETSTLAILAAALWLIYTRNLRWQAPVCALLAAALAAALWPIAGAAGEWQWFPALRRVDGFPIGMTLVLYHLTGGGLLLAAVLHAADPISTPLNVRGHALFGAGLGAGTVVLRACGISFGACWWVLLLMNTLVPLIDRITRRRVWGT